MEFMGWTSSAGSEVGLCPILAMFAKMGKRCGSFLKEMLVVCEIEEGIEIAVESKADLVHEQGGKAL